MNEEEIKEKIISCLPGYKPNPEHLPIIEKWNRRIYQKNKQKIYKTMEECIDLVIKDYFKNNPLSLSELFETFVELKPRDDCNQGYTPSKYGHTYYVDTTNHCD